MRDPGSEPPQTTPSTGAHGPWPVGLMSCVLDRRQFLRRAGALGLSAASAAVAGTLSGCARSSKPTAATTRTAPPTTVPTGRPEYSALAERLSGALIRPGDPAYASARLLYNERFDDSAPAAIARCATPSDVQRCVDFAHRWGVPIAARAGGHSYGGYSTCEGLVVDLSQLATVAVHPGGARATVGAGAQLIDVYQALGSQGALLPAGSCPTVGIAGLTLGGGIGVFDRLYGLTCDNLSSVTLVTADASLVVADPASHADLFWACQGGGGGNFGIATEFEFAVHPVPEELALFTLDWPGSAASDVLAAWQGWLPGLPDQLWSNCQLLGGGDAAVVRVSGVFVGATATLDSLLAPLISSAATSPTSRFVGPEDYLPAMFIEAGCEGISQAACHLTTTPGGTLPRAAFAAKSTFVTEPFGTSALSAAANALDAAADLAHGLGVALLFDSYGGRINQVPPGATAFVHRDALAGIQMTASWGGGAEPPAAVTWLEYAANALAPYTTGAYQNYIDPTLANWPRAYYGSNLERLVVVKRAVDPDDLFHFAQSIPTTLPT
jgi:FAD/FMN-containing dehydrogenase